MNALFVVFRVAETEYVIPASEVLQMESFTGATFVPGAPVYVVGLLQLRGQVVPVVDVRRRFGLPPAELSLDSRVVVVEQTGRVVALLVDSAREVVSIPLAAFEPPPDVVVDQSSGFVRQVARVNNRIVLLVDSAKLIGEGQLHGSSEHPQQSSAGI